jgi:hypothetical protein
MHFGRNIKRERKAREEKTPRKWEDREKRGLKGS